MTSSTIYAASVLWRGADGHMLVPDPRIDLLPDGAAGPRRFKIKTAEAEVRRGMVNKLLKNRYGWRGYREVRLPTDQSVHKFTLMAVEDNNTIGTITVALDGPERLSADDAFPDEVQALRDQGRSLCEFTKLAVDPTVGTKRVLAALFHVAYIVAHRIRHHDTLLIEVNPRHVRYYERMLGFKVLASERINRSVNAPAVLLTVDFSYVMGEIGRLAGHPGRMSTDRSLYSAFMSLREEAAILGKMKAKQALFEQSVGEPARAVGVMPTEFAVSDLLQN